MNVLKWKCPETGKYTKLRGHGDEDMCDQCSAILDDIEFEKHLAFSEGRKPL